MKQITTLITILFISLLSSPSWSETVDYYDLVRRDGLHYKKFTNVPFTGEVTGESRKTIGKIKNGKREGVWTRHDGDCLSSKGFYKDGKQVGLYESFGGCILKHSGFYKNGKKEGLWE